MHWINAIKHFGGVDMLVLNAGIFPASQPIQDIAQDQWRNAMTVNVEANLLVMQACHALLKLAPRGGRIVVIGSKNVPAPGPGRGRLLGLQGGAEPACARRGAGMGEGRHPHQLASIPTRSSTPRCGPRKCSRRAPGLRPEVEQYRRNNLLGTEVTSKDVAELAAEMCGPLFAKTTAAQVPVDGGNERVV